MGLYRNTKMVQLFNIFLLTICGVNAASSPSCKDNCAVFIPGAVAYWQMSSGTERCDLSGNKNCAKIVGLTYTDGPTGEVHGAAHFNGSSNSYATVRNSQSLHIGKYPGFSLSGFFRLGIHHNKSASIIDWSGDGGYGVFLVVTSAKKIQLQLYPRDKFKHHKAEFPNETLINGDWVFIGVSYNKATGRARAFIGGQSHVQKIDENIEAGSDKTHEIGLGIDLTENLKTLFNYNGDMNCMMLFNYALQEVDFRRVWDFCNTTNSTQLSTLPPPPTVTVSNQTSATVSWTQSTGIFSEYIITIERQQSKLGQEIVDPKRILSSATSLKSVLTNLKTGATYRVHVRHIEGRIQGQQARSSDWFDTCMTCTCPTTIMDHTNSGRNGTIALGVSSPLFVIALVVGLMYKNIRPLCTHRDTKYNGGADQPQKDVAAGNNAVTEDEVEIVFKN